jgi:protein YibB
MNNITIVTSFFDIGRGSLPKEKHGRVLPHHQHRTVDQYFDYFNNLAQIENDMVIYTTPDLAPRIYDIRKSYGLENKTKVVISETYLPLGFSEVKDLIQDIMNSPDYYDKITNPHLIEYWHADYVLVNIFKSLYVSDAIQKGFVKDNLAAWIDFGYCRNTTTLSTSKKWSYGFDENKIHLFNMRDIEEDRPIDSIIYTGDVYIQGCHIVAGVDKWKKLEDLMMKSLNVLLNYNLIDDDQTLLLMSYLTEPEEFELHYNDPSDWFTIFKKFNNA